MYETKNGKRRQRLRLSPAIGTGPELRASRTIVVYEEFTIFSEWKIYKIYRNLDKKFSFLEMSKIYEAVPILSHSIPFYQFYGSISEIFRREFRRNLPTYLTTYLPTYLCSARWGLTG